jgi:hypothetical protein
MVQVDIVESISITTLDADGNPVNVNQLVYNLNAIYATTKDLDLGDPTNEKYVDHIIFDLDALEEIESLQVEVGTRDRLKDAIVWSDPQMISLDNPIVNIRTTARFFSLKITDTQPNVQWNLRRIEFYGRVIGGRIEV